MLCTGTLSWIFQTFNATYAIQVKSTHRVVKLQKYVETVRKATCIKIYIISVDHIVNWKLEKEPRSNDVQMRSRE